MHARLSAFTGHLARLGKQLDGAVKTYNSAVGSMERSVLPGARKFVDLGVHAKTELEDPAVIETSARDIEDRSTEADDAPKVAKIDVQKTDADEPPPAH
jgi:DNA recombination protein RmuC